MAFDIIRNDVDEIVNDIIDGDKSLKALYGSLDKEGQEKLVELYKTWLVAAEKVAEANVALENAKKVSNEASDTLDNYIDDIASKNLTDYLSKNHNEFVVGIRWDDSKNNLQSFIVYRGEDMTVPASKAYGQSGIRTISDGDVINITDPDKYYTIPRAEFDANFREPNLEELMAVDRKDMNEYQKIYFVTAVRKSMNDMEEAIHAKAFNDAWMSEEYSNTLDVDVLACEKVLEHRKEREDEMTQALNDAFEREANQESEPALETLQDMDRNSMSSKDKFMYVSMFRESMNEEEKEKFDKVYSELLESSAENGGDTLDYKVAACDVILNDRRVLEEQLMSGLDDLLNEQVEKDMHNFEKEPVSFGRNLNDDLDRDLRDIVLEDLEKNPPTLGEDKDKIVIPRGKEKDKEIYNKERDRELYEKEKNSVVFEVPSGEYVTSKNSTPIRDEIEEDLRKNPPNLEIFDMEVTPVSAYLMKEGFLSPAPSHTNEKSDYSAIIDSIAKSSNDFDAVMKGLEDDIVLGNQKSDIRIEPYELANKNDLMSQAVLGLSAENNEFVVYMQNTRMSYSLGSDVTKVYEEMDKLTDKMVSGAMIVPLQEEVDVAKIQNIHDLNLFAMQEAMFNSSSSKPVSMDNINEDTVLAMLAEQRKVNMQHLAVVGPGKNYDKAFLVDNNFNRIGIIESNSCRGIIDNALGDACKIHTPLELEKYANADLVLHNFSEITKALKEAKSVYVDNERCGQAFENGALVYLHKIRNEHNINTLSAFEAAQCYNDSGYKPRIGSLANHRGKSLELGNEQNK